MSLDQRVKLNRFVVDGHGRLEPDGTATPTLFLRWRGLAVTVCMSAAEPAEAAGSLSMGAVVGRVMSTAGDAARNAARREQTLAQLRELSRTLDDGWRLALLADHRVSVQSARQLMLPAAASGLLTEVICFLLELRPYLDLLAEADFGMEPAGGAAGPNLPPPAS